MSGEASGSSQRPTAVNEDAKQLQREKYRQLHSDTESELCVVVAWVTPIIDR